MAGVPVAADERAQKFAEYFHQKVKHNVEMSTINSSTIPGTDWTLKGHESKLYEALLGWHPGIGISSKKNYESEYQAQLCYGLKCWV